MKYLFLETIYNSPHIETSAEIALDLNKKKNDIFFSWIGNNLSWSDWTLSIGKKILGASIEKKISLIEGILIRNKINLVGLQTKEDLKLKKIKTWASNFSGNLSSLKRYSYKRQNLGLGVCSSLISFLHQSNFDTKKYNKLIYKSLVSSAIIFERSLELIKKTKPDYVVTFNSRFATSLPIVLAAKKEKIKVLRHERGSDFNKYEVFEEDIHNLSYRANNVKSYWKSEKNLKKKQIIAKKYFINRRKGIPLSWDLKKNHALNQLPGYVPPIKKKIRVIFYTASEDEHESTKYQLTNLIWESQNTALKKLIKALNLLKNFELFIRVHPISDKRKSLDDHIKWKKYDNGKNIHVVSHDSPINSYELLDSAQLIVTYGGNIAIEAVYWGKNVITLRNAIYSKEKFIFEPKNFKELSNYIKKLKFLRKPINKSKAIPFAYYFMVYGRKFKHFKCRSFDDCYYKQIPISHLNTGMRKIKKYKNIFQKFI